MKQKVKYLFLGLIIVSGYLLYLFNRKTITYEYREVYDDNCFVSRTYYENVKKEYRQREAVLLWRIDSLKALREQNKVKYKEKLIYITDTCQALYIENLFLRSDTAILAEQVGYYKEALAGCDSQFTTLVNLAEKIDSLKTTRINSLVQDSIRQGGIVTKQQKKMKRKNKTIIKMVGVAVLEGVLIYLLH